MIKEININNCEMFYLEEKFPQIFGEKGIKKDLEDNPFSKYLIYVDGKEIKGFVNYTILYDRVEIININVLDIYKRKGIGSELLKRVIEKAIVSECNNITLEVSVNNKSAISLYEKFGFKQVALRKGYYNGIDAILMEKEMM